MAPGRQRGRYWDDTALQSLDVVDTSSDMLALSTEIYRGRRNPLQDPRVKAHIEDGRYFLLTTDREYDVITAEPPPPRVPGAVSLYTREYFQLMRRRLAGRRRCDRTGCRCTTNLLVSSAKGIVRAFCDVFSDCSLWGGAPFDWMLVGTRTSHGPITEARFSAPWRDPALSARLREVAFESPEQIGAAFLQTGPSCGSWLPACRR